MNVKFYKLTNYKFKKTKVFVNETQIFNIDIWLFSAEQ